MAHRAGAEFFDSKKTWSIRKDRILARYLAPYLAKVNRLNRHILLVDGFAGAGQFNDGTPGSPLIMRDAIERINPTSGASVLAIEREPDTFARLQALFADDPVVETRNASLEDSIDDIRARAVGRSLFLYLDPWTVRGLELTGLHPVFDLVRHGQSVEALINFNAVTFGRWALAALKRPPPPDIEEDEVPTRPEIEELDRIVGGGWWQDVVSTKATFREQVTSIVEGYCHQLRSRFREVCCYELFHRSRHQLPKYVLVFASRHPDAMELMNDEMVQSDRALLEQEAAGQIDLFDVTVTGLSTDADQIRSRLEEFGKHPIERKALVQEVLRADFGRYLGKEVRAQIRQCLKVGVMKSATGKVQVGNKDRVWFESGS